MERNDERRRRGTIQRCRCGTQDHFDDRSGMFPGPQCLAQIPWGAVSRLRRSEFIHINPRLAPWATVRSRLTALGLFTLVRDIMCYTNSGTALAGRVSAATRCKSSHWFSVLMSSGYL